VSTAGGPPELLAPAGDWDCLRAAAAAGADAVYFGMTQFSARARATNFRPGELGAVMDFLRARNVRGCVAMNTLIFPDELERAAELVSLIAAAGCDAVIVQDLGLARLVHRMVPTLPIHASTQMTLTEPRGIELVRRELGVARVILPRELSLAQIGALAAATAVELEVFVHGALCISYSGQCLASLVLPGKSGGRSANRGECAQPCRLPYELLLTRGHGPEAAGAAGGSVRVPEAKAGARPYPLSPRDLAAWELLPELVRLGVRGFKIEGRLKSAGYVQAATAFYRKALDAAVAGRKFAPSADELAALEMSFSRGFTRGFLAGTDHQELVEGRTPKPRGVRLGTVAGRTARGVVVALQAELRPGDGLVFDAGGPERDEQGGRVFAVRPLPQKRGGQAGKTRLVELTFGRGDVNLAAVAVGSAVWKTDDPALEKRLARALAAARPARRVPLTLRASGQVGGALRLVLGDDAGHEVEVAWPGPLRQAEKHPLTAALLREQLGRLGGTAFELGAVDAAGVGPVMVPKSILNALRREAVAKLLALRAAAARRAVAEPDALGALRGTCPPPRHQDTEKGLSLNVLVRTPEQLQAALDWQPGDGLGRPALVYGDFAEAGKYAGAVVAARAAGLRIGLATPRITEPGEDHLLQRIADCAPGAVLVRSLAALEFFRGRGSETELVGDFTLNAANELSAGFLAGLGLARLAPAWDADWPRLRSLFDHADPARFEVVIHGHAPMFHVKHCLYAAGQPANRSCADCARPCARGGLELRDRKGAVHPVLADAAGRNTVFCGPVQDRMDRVPAMAALGLRHFRVELLDEDARRVRALLDRAARALHG